MTVRPWTAADDRLLRQLWAEHKPTAQITPHFPGRSRNSILGRAGRLGLEKRGNPVPKGRKKPPAEAKQKPLAVYVDREPCPRCQVRGDIGCEHRGANEAAPVLAVK